MDFDKNKIVAALRKVTDPQTGNDIIARRMVEDLITDSDQINFTLILPSLQSEFKSELIFSCIEQVQALYPEAKVNVHTKVRHDQAVGQERQASQIRNIIAVASGKGGVGKSTVSVNLALALRQQGASVGLLDADLYGPSIPTMLGLQGQRPLVKEVYGQSKIVPLEAHGMPVMSLGNIIEPEQAVVLRGPRLAAIIKQFFQDTLWPELDFLIVDLPPGTGDIQLTLVQTVAVKGAIIVTTPQEVAVIDALKAMNMFLLPAIHVPVLGVVENMSWFTPEELPEARYYLFGQGGGKRLAREGETVLLGQVPLVQGIREGGDAGQPVFLQESSPVAQEFMSIARHLLRQIAVLEEVTAV